MATYSRRGRACAFGRESRSAFTLIELMVAIAATLIIIAAVAQAFSMLGNDMTKGRALLETMDRLRTTRQMLQNDLLGRTARTLSWLESSAGGGYFEAIEGPQRDFNDSGYQVWVQWTDADGNNVPDTRFGDMDDVLALTVRSRGAPFVQEINGSTIESDLAEVIWFVVPGGTTPSGVKLPGKLYRRFRIIERNEQAGDTSLSRLTLRQNRWMHSTGYPYQLQIASLITAPSDDDIVLTNVLAFDVRVWDPGAPLYGDSSIGMAVEPGDPGYTAGSGTPIGMGAFVDLGYSCTTRSGIGYPGDPVPSLTTQNATSHFRHNGFVNLVQGAADYRVWDTWPKDYEYDGEDQDGREGPDQGTNGFDDPDKNGNRTGGVDDPGEWETTPPYLHPLRGIQVRIRVYEPSSRQIRELSVVQEFMPE